MAAVAITGWEKGCNSVAAIKEIRARAGVPLNDALALVNRVLAKEKVVVSVPCQTEARQIVEALAKVGMTAQIVDDLQVDSSAQPILSERP